MQLVLPMRSGDLFELDPASGDAQVFLDDAGLFDGVERNLDASSLLSVPEPGRLLLLAVGAGVLVALRRVSRV
jgi:hypothetical protein